MHLVQILLPVTDEQGRPFSAGTFESVHHELTERFGGVTAFIQSPAMGLWKEAPGEEPERDRVVLVEVMVAKLERDWWAAFRQRLEELFRQDEVLIRSSVVDRL